MTGSGRTDRAEGFVGAEPAMVFAAWSDPAILSRWLAPEGMAARVERLDLRAGGGFRIVLTHDDPAQAGTSDRGTDVVEGQFVSVDPPGHLAFVSRFDSDDPALQGTMRMDWDFRPEGDGTRVRITAQDVLAGIAPGDHAEGMGATLRKLSALFGHRG
jgi:uncharacterized protein YndB with AHSA1/START domain